MKKLYTAPSIEKISFRYRDQVVAASGDATQTDPTSEWSGGYVCGSDRLDKFVEGALDGQVCSWS